MTYECPGLNGIRRSRVRGSDDAARRFAHRLAIKVFGRAGRAFAVRRVRHGARWVQYEAELGRLNGPRTTTMLTVTEKI